MPKMFGIQLNRKNSETVRLVKVALGSLKTHGESLLGLFTPVQHTFS